VLRLEIHFVTELEVQTRNEDSCIYTLNQEKSCLNPKLKRESEVVRYEPGAILCVFRSTTEGNQEYSHLNPKPKQESEVVRYEPGATLCEFRSTVEGNQSLRFF